MRCLRVSGARAPSRMLVAVAVLASLAAAAIVNREPVPIPDDQLYASIARSLQLHGSGVPSILEASPYAVNHVPFYGPVYFALVAAAYALDPEDDDQGNGHGHAVSLLSGAVANRCLAVAPRPAAVPAGARRAFTAPLG